MYSHVFNMISRYSTYVFNFKSTLLLRGGDSHTSTHGAFGSLAFGLSLKLCRTGTAGTGSGRIASIRSAGVGSFPLGIGTSEVEHVLATQTLQGDQGDPEPTQHRDFHAGL